MLISPGDMIVQQSPGLLTIRQSQDLKMAAAGVRERVVFLVFEVFSPHRYGRYTNERQKLKWT